MPVTANLSRKLYDVLSEDVVTELVEWFNLVDATYRTDLRELNELNFGRFDAKLEQRFAQADTETRRQLAELRADLDGKWERRFNELSVDLERRFGAIDARFTRFEERLRSEFAVQRAELLKWMFLFWATTALGVIGLIKF